MPREVDPRRTRKALRAIRKLGASAGARESSDPPPDQTTELSDWERSFLTELEARLHQYGSAFADLAKGAPDDALSRLQATKLKEIAAKAAGKPRSRAFSNGLKRRAPLRRSKSGDSEA